MFRKIIAAATIWGLQWCGLYLLIDIGSSILNIHDVSVGKLSAFLATCIVFYNWKKINAHFDEEDN